MRRERSSNLWRRSNPSGYTSFASPQYRRKVDDNQSTIVAALRGAQFQVILMHTVGAGFPDLIVTKNGRAWFIEVKSSKGRLTPAQEVFFAEWRGPKIHIARSVDQALEIVGA